MHSQKPVVLFLTRTYLWFIASANLLRSPVLLLLRLWGWQYLTDGWGKLTHHGKVASFFTDLGLPLPGMTAWFVGGVEFFGGIFLLVGLLSRPVALILAINMFMAFMSVPDDRSTFFHAFSDPDTFIKAGPFIYLLVAVIILAFGPGVFSLDALFSRLIRRKLKASQPGYVPSLARSTY